MASSHGLGRGLGSLIPKVSTVAAPAVAPAPAPSVLQSDFSSPAGTPLEVPIERVVPNPHQPREHFAHDKLEELVASIQEHGVLQPLVVTERMDGTYELIAGERRLRASRLAGKSTVPVFVRSANEQQKLELALIENIQRQDLDIIEEAKAYRALMDEHDLTQEQVAKRVGKSRSQVANTLRLLELPSDILAAVQSGELTMSAARTLLALPTKDEQLAWWQKMTAQHLTVREMEEAARRVRGPRSVNIPNANLEADESAVRGSLGTKVTIKKRGEAGSITLSFFSQEEYQELIQRLTKE